MTVQLELLAREGRTQRQPPPVQHFRRSGLLQASHLHFKGKSAAEDDGQPMLGDQFGRIGQEPQAGRLCGDGGFHLFLYSRIANAVKAKLVCVDPLDHGFDSIIDLLVVYPESFRILTAADDSALPG